MATLTKSELTDIVVARVPKISRNDAKLLVELFFEEIKSALAAGADVKISGFGNFQLRNKNQRPGRNPKTGQEVEISARRVVTFHSSQKLKALIEHQLSS
ncbi:MAG: integration host factor subunit alpha [Neisseriaceae bacterium]